MNTASWLIVANSSLARIFKIEKGKILMQIKLLEHPESRLHNMDLVSDKPGRVNESASITRHAIEQKTTPKEHEFEVFAKIISDFLTIAHNEGEFEALYISATPSLLGLLREKMSPGLVKAIKGEVDKDLTHITSQEIPTHLSFWL